MGRSVRLLVCVGDDCRRSKGHDKAVAVAAETEDAAAVACQGICRGPVVGVERDGELRWYAKVRGDRRRALERLARTGSDRRALRSAEIRRLRGRLRKPTRARPLAKR
jgi:hypothetical protein